MRKKISTTIYITPEQDMWLRELSERTRVPISVYIRQGIDMALKHHEKDTPYKQLSIDISDTQVK